MRDMDLENLKAWQAFAAGLAGAVLVFVGRISGTWKMFRKDGAEGSLFTQLSTALETSEKRRAEEAAAYREREAAHERRHAENMERMLELTRQVAEMKGALMAMERQYADVSNALARADETIKNLTREVSEWRQLHLPTPAHEPGKPAIITGG